MAINISVITGSRAEFGLLRPLILEINKSQILNLRLIVTGSHFSKKYGETIKEITDENIKIHSKIKILSGDNSEHGISKSISTGISKFSEEFKKNRPNLILILGDRFELYCPAIVANIFKIPIAHMCGGEKTSGAIDDSIRHAITKLSFLHFTQSKEYRKRVVQLGESPERVFNVGAIAIDNIRSFNLLSKNKLESSINLKISDKAILVTFHPITLDEKNAKEQFKIVLKALESFKETQIIFTKSNADAGGEIINSLINEFVRVNDKAVCFDSLGTLRYLSLLNFISGVVGNSSSGMLEVPYFDIATVNIGDRQDGRIKFNSIIDCELEFDSIVNGIKRMLDKDYASSKEKVIETYGDGNAAKNICKILEGFDYKIPKKKFFDIEFKNE